MITTLLNIRKSGLKSDENLVERGPKITCSRDGFICLLVYLFFSQQKKTKTQIDL